MSNPDELAGPIGTFDPKTETVSSYDERLLLYLTANNIPDNNPDRRKAIYKALSELCSRDKVASKTLDQLLMKLKDQQSDSGVELRTLDYENPDSNPGCGVETLGKFFHSTLLQFTQLNKWVSDYRQWWICVRAAFAH